MENVSGKWLVIVWIFGMLVPRVKPQQFPEALTFEKEKIRINIRNDDYQLIGDYYFKNSSSKRTRRVIYYPVVKKKHLPFPHFFKVIDLLRDENVKFVADSNGISFQVDIPPYSVGTYRVEYHQKTPANELEYILTTTTLWGKPLKSADFEISLPKNFVPDSLSLPFQKKKVSTGETILLIHEENFLPRKNLIMQWRPCDVKKVP